ncbi:hypothetical protein BGZ96_005859 [Linnemannia gamsii]|uniref:ASX DEUBAD domain-containing protein n=1 Tax=Linnemannia gamsii TaxID=64522 RepID=A0ABQ7KGV7_9FUNG|nr:hypothetical protein BGZ96_005859 [Linnemannia gamsii]
MNPSPSLPPSPPPHPPQPTFITVMDPQSPPISTTTVAHTDPIEKEMSGPRDSISQRLSSRKRTLHIPLNLSTQETGVRSWRGRYKRRKPNNVTTTSSSSFTISLKEHHRAESTTSSTEERPGTPTGHQREAYSQSPDSTPPAKRTNHTSFIIDLTTIQRKAYNSNKRNAFSKASSRKQASFQSDDEWTPATAPCKAAHKATISKQIARAKATAKVDTGHSTDSALERLACIQIPSNARFSGPSNGRTQRLLHIDIKNNIKPTVTQARIDAKGNSASNADNSVTDIFLTTEAIDNNEVETSASNVHRSVIDFNTLATPTSTVDNTKLSFFDAHTFENITKPNDQIFGRSSRSDDDVLVKIKPNSPDAHPINSIRKPGDEIIISSIQDLCSPPPTPSPHPSATGGTDEDLLPRNTDQDNVNRIDSTSSVNSAPKTHISPACVSAIEISHAHDGYSQHETDVSRSTISGSSLPEEMNTTLVDSDFIHSDLLKDLTHSRINPTTPKQTHSQSLAVAVMFANSTDTNNASDPLDASDSRTRHLDDTLDTPLASRKTLFSAANAITVDTQSMEVDPLSVSPGDTHDNQMASQTASQTARTTSAAHFDQAAPQSAVTLLSEPNTTKPGLSDPLTDPHSKYATGDINNVISYETYSQFPAKTQRAFVDHLPACIRNNPRYLDCKSGTANEAFFSMLSFNRAKLDWQKALVEGKFTDEYKTKVAALIREDDERKMATSGVRTTITTTAAMMEGHRGEMWKSDDFERFYGEKAIQASARKMEAGDSSKTSLAKICLNKGIQIGDLLLYVREFTVKPPPQQQPSPRRKSKVNVAATTTSTATITTTTTKVAAQTARRRWIARLSRMAMIDKRDNKDRASVSSRAGRIKVDQLMQVLDITKSGRPIIGFIDGDGCSNRKDHKSTGGEWSKPLAAATAAGTLVPAMTANTATTTTATLTTPTTTTTTIVAATAIEAAAATARTRTNPTTAAVAAAVVVKASPRKSEKAQQLQQLQLRSPASTAKLTGTYEIDSAPMVERICLERDGQVPKAYRKNAFESWKHIHTFRPIARELEDQERVKLEEGEGEVDVVYVGSLFSMRMDIYNHLQSENAKRQVLLEDAATIAD